MLCSRVWRSCSVLTAGSTELGIATPVCALARNDCGMKKTTARLRGRLLFDSVCYLPKSQLRDLIHSMMEGMMSVRDLEEVYMPM